MKGGDTYMHLAKFLKGLDTSLENNGDELILSVKGDKEKLMVLEKKLKALKELCCGDGCCSDESDGTCC